MEYDAILYIDRRDVNEIADARLMQVGGRSGRETSFGVFRGTNGSNTSYNYGSVLRGALSLGNSYQVEVYDYNTECVVRVTYTNTKTCKSASQCFLIIFDAWEKSGKGVVKSTSARSRSISDVGQAASYIKSRASSLASKCSNGD